MTVISVSLSGELLADFDKLVKHFGYDNRSSAVRDALYQYVAQHRLEFGEHADLVFTLVYDPRKRQEEVHELVHAHTELVRTSLHNHMGEKCVDVLLVQGPGEAVHKLLDRLTALRDVRVNVTPL